MVYLKGVPEIEGNCVSWMKSAGGMLNMEVQCVRIYHDKLYGVLRVRWKRGWYGRCRLWRQRR